MIETTTDRPNGLQPLADKHGFSLEAVRYMLHALERGNGTMAQFDHPAFGGMGQWFAGGMVMTGRMNDHALKARVCALCDELASSLPAVAWHASAASSSMAATSASGGASAWWPAGLGRPSSVGAQNTTRYAYFPESRRLAVEIDGRQDLYDTGPHIITGVSQQQGGTHTMRFSSAQGTVSLDDLTRVERSEAQPAAAPERSRTVAEPAPAAPDASPGPASDVFAALERLADLNRKGILTDEEFAAKKAELLARL